MMSRFSILSERVNEARKPCELECEHRSKLSKCSQCYVPAVYREPSRLWCKHERKFYDCNLCKDKESTTTKHLLQLHASTLLGL